MKKRSRPEAHQRGSGADSKVVIHVAIRTRAAEVGSSLKFLTPVRKLFGYPAQKFKRMDGFLESLVHPEDLRGVRLPSAAMRRQKLELHYRVRHADGKYRWVHELVRQQAVFPGASAETLTCLIECNSKRLTKELQSLAKTELDRIAFNRVKALAKARTREQLQRNQDRLDFALRDTYDGLWDWDLVTDEVYYSPRWKDMLGYADGEIENHLKAWERLVDPADRQRILDELARYVASSEKKYESEFRIRHKAGHWVYILCRATVVRDRAGQPRRLMGANVDITARKTSELALRESEATLRAFYDSPGFMRGLVEVVGDDVKHISDNAVTAQFHGRDQAALRNKFSSELGVPRGVIQMWIGHYETARRTGTSVEFEFEYGAGSGKRVYQAVASYMGPGASGPRFAYAVLDITARKVSELALRESEAALRAFYDSPGFLRGFVEVIGDDIKHISDNAVTAAFLGRDLQSIRNQFASELGVPREIIQLWIGHYKTCLQTGGSVEFEYEHPNDNGRPQHLQAIVSHMGAGVCGPRFAYAVLDITARKEAELALQAERAQLEQRVRERTKELASAHSRLQLALDASNAGVWSWNMHTGVAKWDESYRRLYGFPPEESPTYEAWMERVHPDDRERLRAHILELLKSRSRTWDEDFRILHPTLGVRWMQGLGRVELDDDGQAMLLVGINLDVTARKQAESALRESDARYRQLIHNMRDGFAMVDMDGRVVECNTAYEAMLGYSPAEIRRVPCSGYTPARWHEMEARIIREQVLTAGYSQVYQKEYVHADGRVFPVELRAVLVRDEAGQPVGMWAVIRDITDRMESETKRKEAELLLRKLNETLEQRVTERAEELRASEKRFRTFAEAAFEGVLISQGGRILDCNDQMSVILGRPRNELIGRAILDFVVPTSRDTVWKAIHEGVEVHMEHEICRPDGNRCFVETHGRSPDGPDGVRVTVIRNITAYKLSEQALSESQGRFRLLAEASFEGIAIMEEGTLRDCNSQVAAMFGYEPHELIGRPVSDFIAPESREEVEVNVRAGREEPYEFMGLRKDGTIFPAEARARMMVRDGRTIRITVVRDLTEIRQASADLDRQRIQLVRAQRLAELSEVSTSVIHQIGQPFTAIINNISAAKTMVSRCSSHTCRASAILMDTDASLKLVQTTMNRLRALTHPERVRREWTDLKALVADVARLLQPEMEAQGIVLRASLSPELPLISVDEVQFTQVLLNLMRNACEAVSGCEPDRRLVTVTADGDHGGQITIKITDQGVGIAASDQPKLFEPFFTTKPNGTGVGLRLCQTIVTAHGGTLNGYNNESVGATFEIVLPRPEGGVHVS